MLEQYQVSKEFPPLIREWLHIWFGSETSNMLANVCKGCTMAFLSTKTTIFSALLFSHSHALPHTHPNMFSLYVFSFAFRFYTYQFSRRAILYRTVCNCLQKFMFSLFALCTICLCLSHFRIRYIDAIWRNISAAQLHP